LRAVNKSLALLIEVTVGWPFFWLASVAIWISKGAAASAHWLRGKPTLGTR
jgi:hypothetical protein